MILRPLLLALAALAVAAPTAGAATLGDRLVPTFGAEDGVTVGKDAKGRFIGFSPKAAKVYRRIAGKRVVVFCMQATGAPRNFNVDNVDAPRKRSRISLAGVARGADLCTLSRKRGKGEICVANFGVDDKDCARVIVALTEAGSKHLDSVERTNELWTVEFAVEFARASGEMQALREQFGAYITELAGPDDAPPAGKVGYWLQGEDTVYSTLLADGTRRFVSRRAGVFSTNDPVRMNGDDGVFSIYF